jgi:hypothetical protein
MQEGYAKSHAYEKRQGIEIQMFMNLQIPPPANWQDFEILCCDLWRAIWKDPNTQRNGRQGQPQHGVDIYGRPNQQDFWAGVQCKGRANYTNKFLSKETVLTEIEKAEYFEPKLSQYIIATTGPKDVKIEELARKITEEHLKQELFSVHILGWNDIVARLADFPGLVEKYYPGLALNAAELKREIDTLKRMAELHRENGTQTISMDPLWFRKDTIMYVYLDILGIEPIAEKIAQEKGIEKRKVEENLITVLKERVETTKRKVIVDYHGWYIAAHGLDDVFRSISEILDHNTGFIGYEKIPLGIGVGTTRNKKVMLSELTACYQSWRKTHIKKEEESFIILTESLYQQLEPFDRKMCTRIDYADNENSSVFYVIDTLAILKRGKIFEFLQEIGYPGSRLYGRIDHLYIPPVEYDAIKDVLQKKHIVFITGTQEYGKTYTAVRLMWEYYERGYQPIWIKGGEERERITARGKLEDIESVLKPHCILYFEDPFGRRTYEGKEILEREIGTIIDIIKRLKDTHVIITARREIFKEFENKKLPRDDLKEFEKRLNLKKPSYDYKKRKEILLKWAENEGCIWLNNDGVLKLVLETIRDERVLPTPLSMRDFSKATIDMGTGRQLTQKMREKSEETAMAFSREIKNMSDDKILFLLFLSICGRCKPDFMSETYGELVKELELTDAWEFDRVLYWFKDDKVTLGEYVEFCHPSYAEALRYVLVENGHATRINKTIFNKLLLNLCEKDDVSGDVAWTIAYNFDSVSEAVQNLLVTLCEKDDVARVVAWHAVHNFEDLTSDVQNLLVTLCERDDVSGDVAWTIAYNFDSVSEAVQNLLVTLCEKDRTAGTAAHAVLQNFDKLPDKMRNNLLLTLSEKSEAVGYVAHTVLQNFDKLPDKMRNNLLLTLSEKSEASRDIAHIVARDFDKLSSRVRINLLLTLSEKNETAGTVVNAVAQHFDNFSDRERNKLLQNFPGDVRNNVLLILAEKQESVEHVALFVTRNFRKLPRGVRNSLLLKLAGRNRTAHVLAGFIAKSYDKIPDTTRNSILLKFPLPIRNDLLFDLAQRDKTSEVAAQFVINYFDKVPIEVRKTLLSQLSEKERAARYLAHFVAEHFNRVPEPIRNDLLIAILEKNKAVGTVAHILEQNFMRFPSHTRDNLLLNLPDGIRNDMLVTFSEKNRAAVAVAGFVFKYFMELPSTVRNNLLVTLSEKESAAGIVAGIVVKYFMELPSTVRNNLLVTLSEKESAAGIVAGTVAHHFNKFSLSVRNRLLVNLSETDEAARYAVKIVSRNFDKLPGKMRNKRLLKLAEKDETAGDVIQIVLHNFDKLPGTVRNKLLLKLAKKDETAGDVVQIVSRNFDKLPGTTRNNLLATLSQKDEAVKIATKFVIKDYDKFSEDVRLFLFHLSEK